MTAVVSAAHPAEERLRWLATALDDPFGMTASDLEGRYDMSEWRDGWTLESELEFFRTGRHSGSRPLVIERAPELGEWQATVVLLGGDGKRWSLTVWVEEAPPHRINGARIVPAPPDGIVLRDAVEEDGPALAELERRAPLRLGRPGEPLTFMTFDHGDDYFGPSRLMEQVTIYVAEDDEGICGAYCGAVQPVLVEGERKRLFLEHHVRIDPRTQRGGVFWALCSFGRDRYARDTDSIAFYVSVDNFAVRKFMEGGPPAWSVQPLRLLLPCSVGEGAPAVGQGASAADEEAVAAVLDAAYEGAPLYEPAAGGRLAERLSRDPGQYSWEDVRLVPGAAALGVLRPLVTVTKEHEGDVRRTCRATALDHGFVPGHEADYRALLLATCASLAERGATHLAVYTSERSASYPVLAELADEVERYDFWTFDIAEPAEALQRTGFYVDPIYF